jgi:hypothetical protein
VLSFLAHRFLHDPVVAEKAHETINVGLETLHHYTVDGNATRSMLDFRQCFIAQSCNLSEAALRVAERYGGHPNGGGGKTTPLSDMSDMTVTKAKDYSDRQ